MDKNKISKFQDRLKISIDENNISQVRLAELLQISQSTISKWLNSEGTHSPTLLQIINLGEHLKIDLNWLLLGKKNEVISYNKSVVDSASDDFIMREKVSLNMQMNFLKEIHECKVEIMMLKSQLENCINNK